jgi:hypothetical protein
MLFAESNMSGGALFLTIYNCISALLLLLCQSLWYLKMTEILPNEQVEQDEWHSEHILSTVFLMPVYSGHWLTHLDASACGMDCTSTLTQFGRKQLLFARMQDPN